jgi:acyl-coenzyme A thioesterase PaaI-like protein
LGSAITTNSAADETAAAAGSEVLPLGGNGAIAPAVVEVTGSIVPNPTAKGRQRRTLFDRIEAFLSRLSTRNNFWHRVCSLIWLPFAFRSGIKMNRIDGNTFQAVLPFRRFNRNWYNAMAGAALLGNSEIAGGMYVFGVCGGDYTVVCKELSYRFLRPCFGPALYRITPREDIAAHLAHKGEFNITVDLDIVQMIGKAGKLGSTPDRERRVGRCNITFHVTPKAHHKNKAERKIATKDSDSDPARSDDTLAP